MATFFEARKAEKIFKEYRDLAIQFWDIDETPSRFNRRSAGHEQVDAEKWTALRQRINKLSPIVQFYAQAVGIRTRGHAMPPAMIGGTAFPFDFLTQVLDREVGYSSIPRKDVLDVIDRCIGAAEHIQKITFWKQAMNPIYYLTITVASILRVPFMILEAAGIPDEVEKSVWAHIVKGAFLLFLIWVTAHYGFKVNFSDLSNLIK